MLTELPSRKEINHGCNLKPGSELLPTGTPSTDKLVEQINAKCNNAEKLLHMYCTPNAQNTVIIFCVTTL